MDAMQQGYSVAVLPSEEGWAVWVPGLPGCASQGATEDEALDNIRDAICDYLAVQGDLARLAGAVSRTISVRV
jgi:predicted RNase H-like HicB family nuclease